MIYFSLVLISSTKFIKLIVCFFDNTEPRYNYWTKFGVRNKYIPRPLEIKIRRRNSMYSEYHAIHKAGEYVLLCMHLLYEHVVIIDADDKFI